MVFFSKKENGFILIEMFMLMWRKHFRLTPLLLLFASISFEGCTSVMEPELTISEQKTEFLTNPMGIETQNPHFSWIMNSASRSQGQTAYRILVASTISNLNSNIGDIWDSGKVTSDMSVSVRYLGRALASGERCHWKVQVWDKGNVASRWSENAWFEMGLLEASDWGGDWIGASEEGSIQLRKQFTLDKPVARARVYLVGLGCNALHINGNRIGDKVHAIHAYNAKSCYYSIYDVTSNL